MPLSWGWSPALALYIPSDFQPKRRNSKFHGEGSKGRRGLVVGGLGACDVRGWVLGVCDGFCHRGGDPSTMVPALRGSAFPHIFGGVNRLVFVYVISEVSPHFELVCRPPGLCAGSVLVPVDLRGAV
ncbi:hypothetical protein TIFTF001_036760 [Ficus carica]|uniref:Uncharacterized protein n=1 Tax=Ficus carica TaxID=3494 RepID=A0AA88JBM1_FICCA|nr:hypothetical protein TIFTF001_036760 [Ficus carica]